MAKITGLDGMPIEAEEKQVSLTLKQSFPSGKLSIDGDLRNLDQTINMLQQALRWLEARYNVYQQMQVMSEVQRDQQLMEMTRQ